MISIPQAAEVHLEVIVAISILLFSVSALVIIVVLRNNKLKFYKKEYEFEKERNIIPKHYDYFSKYANDIIFLVFKN
jgi:hypothetical protein